MCGYFPSVEDDLLVWFADHSAGVATRGATVGPSAADLMQGSSDDKIVTLAVNRRSRHDWKT